MKLYGFRSLKAVLHDEVGMADDRDTRFIVVRDVCWWLGEKASADDEKAAATSAAERNAICRNDGIIFSW